VGVSSACAWAWARAVFTFALRSRLEARTCAACASGQRGTAPDMARLATSNWQLATGNLQLINRVESHRQSGCTAGRTLLPPSYVEPVYLVRHRTSGPLADLRQARHLAQLQPPFASVVVAPGLFAASTANQPPRFGGRRCACNASQCHHSRRCRCCIRRCSTDAQGLTPPERPAWLLAALVVRFCFWRAVRRASGEPQEKPTRSRGG